jgi:Ca-activated chloride channel family protein
LDWLWPDVILLVGLVPLLVALYVGTLRWRCRFVIRYSSFSGADRSLFQASFLRRHLPSLLFLLALTSLILAMARPITSESVLSGRTTIVLTLDVSRSMCMRDIFPNRLTVAKDAALAFIHQPVLGTQVGIVAFSGFAELAQEPTADLHLLEDTITNLTTATQTAIGSAILRSLDAIAEVDDRVAPSADASLLPLSESSTPRSPEEYVPHIIVLLTDGSSNTGSPPLLAAQQAAERGVRIYSIGFGTTRNAVMDCWSVPGDEPLTNSRPSAGGGSFGSGPDEATLKQIAEMTGGKFYSATGAEELRAVFHDLHNFVAMTNQTIEVSVFFTAVGVLVAMAAFLVSIFWHPVV